VEVRLDRVEGEDVLEEGDVGLDRVDDLDLEGSNLELTESSEVDLRELRRKRSILLGKVEEKDDAERTSGKSMSLYSLIVLETS
jgi:hypothetical protein